MIQGFVVVGLDKNNHLVSTDAYGDQKTAMLSARDLGINFKYARMLYINIEKTNDEPLTIPVINVEIK